MTIHNDAVQVQNRLDSLVDILHANNDPDNLMFRVAADYLSAAAEKLRVGLMIADKEATRLNFQVHYRQEGELGEQAEQTFVAEAMAYNARKRGK